MKRILKKKSRIILLALLVLLAFFATAYALFDRTPELDLSGHYIFAEISECVDLGNAAGTFERYESPENDKHLGDLSYTNYFGGEYRSSEVSFEIHAYEFASVEEARQYFCSVSGSRGIQYDLWGYALTTPFRCRIVAFDHEKAYAVYTSKSDAEEVQELLSELFSVELDLEKETLNKTMELYD